MKTTKVILSILVLFLVAGVQSVMAQPGPGPVFNPVPLDGGITLLLAAGAALGAKKALNARKEK